MQPARMQELEWLYALEADAVDFVDIAAVTEDGAELLFQAEKLQDVVRCLIREWLEKEIKQREGTN